jgi:hypothetical protein
MSKRSATKWRQVSKVNGSGETVTIGVDGDARSSVESSGSLVIHSTTPFSV